MHRVRTPDGCLTGFGQAEEADFSRLLQRRHRADCLLDRNRRVDAMLVIHVDGVDAESLQRGVTRTPDVFGRPVDSEPRAVFAPNIAELRREYDLAAAIANGSTDEALVGERAVRVRRIQEIDPELQRAMDRRDRLRIVVLAVELRHAHAAESHRGHSWTTSAELTLVHDANVFDLRRRSSMA